MLTQTSAEKFASEWIQAWNVHDLDRILSHYAADCELTSPFVKRVLGNGQDTVSGLNKLRSYFSRAFILYPDLQFVLGCVYVGVASVVIEYQSVANLAAAEHLEFNESGLIHRVRAHYTSSHSATAKTANKS
jgi:hypothetical protein